MPTPTYEALVSLDKLALYDTKIKQVIATKADDTSVVKVVTVGGDAVTMTNNQIALGDAAGKSTESTLTDGQNLPTGAAVKRYVDDEVSSAVTSAVRYRGTVASYSALPASGMAVGDMYNVTNADPTHGVRAGDNVVWSGTAWDVQSGTLDLSAYVPYSDVTLATDAQINALFA